MASEENGAATAVDLKTKTCKHCVAAADKRKECVWQWHAAESPYSSWLSLIDLGVILLLSAVLVFVSPGKVTTILMSFFVVSLMAGGMMFLCGALFTMSLAIRKRVYRRFSITFYCYMGDGSNEDLQRAGWHVHLTDAGLEIIPHLTLVAPFTETSTVGSWGVANPGDILEYQDIGSFELKRVRLYDGYNDHMDISDWQQLVSIKDKDYVHTVMRDYTRSAQGSAGSLPAKVVATVVECARADHNTQQSRTVGAAWMQVLEELARDTRLPSMAPDAQREFVQRTCARILSVARAKQPVKN